MAFKTLSVVCTLAILVLTRPCRAQDPLDDLNNRIEFLQTMEKVVTSEIDRRQTPLVFDRKDPPPSHQAALAEAQVKARWMKSAVDQAAESYHRAAATSDPTVRNVLLKEASTRADTAHQLVKYYLGNDVDSTRPSPEFRQDFGVISAQNAKINADMRELVNVCIQIDETAHDKTDWKVTSDLLRKRDEMEAATDRYLQSSKKVTSASFMAEANFWRRAAQLELFKAQRLQDEILTRVRSGDAELFPAMAQMLRSSDPTDRARAESVLRDRYGEVQGADVPKLIELLRQMPTQSELSAKPELKKLTGFASNIFNEFGLHHERLVQVAKQSDADAKLKAAKREWGNGRAGGGGVSLHLPALMKGVDPNVVKRAKLVGDRFVLSTQDGRELRLPKIPLDDLAVALRTIYGPHATLAGKLLAVDGEAIVFDTGPDAFGEVVWRRSYFPQMVDLGGVDEKIELPIGPAVGILNLPEPSWSRITFYGDIKNTRLGDVISRADQLLAVWFYGVDRDSGKFLPLPQVKDFMTMIERQSRSQSQPNSPPTTDSDDPHAGAWWRSSTWYVFVPRVVTYRHDEETNEIVLAESKMQLDSWKTGPVGPSAASVRFVDSVNRNMGALSNAYPVLEELNEIAATVALVRWLKTNNIPVDLQWALERNVAKVITPERIRTVNVFGPRGPDGKPFLKRGGQREKWW